jgi:hypothetical protein
MYHLEGNTDQDTTLLAELYQVAKTRWLNMGVKKGGVQGQGQEHRPAVSRAGTQEEVRKAEGEKGK